MEDFEGRLDQVRAQVARKIMGVWQTKVSIRVLEEPSYWHEVDSVLAMLTEARDRMVLAGVAEPTFDFEAEFDERYGSTFTLTMQGSRPATREEIARAKRVEVTEQRERERALREDLARLEAEIARVTSDLSEEGSP
jgi:hypothetical protein